MNGLREAQRRFMAALRAPAGAEAPGLAVYREAWDARACDTLAAAYPVVRRLVGAAFFDEMARRYRDSHPSRSGDLAEFGSSVPSFIDGYEPAAGLGYLGSVASLEWSVHEAGRIPAARPFDFAALASIEPEGLFQARCVLHPSLRLHDGDQPVVAIWQANQPGRDGSPAGALEPELAAVWHGCDGIEVRALPRERFDCLRALADGAPLGEATGSVAGDAGFGAWFAECAARGLVASIHPA